MLVAQIRDPLNRIFCSCAIKDDDPLNDDGTFSCYPRNIGGSFLLYGKKRSHFPYQCYVGPDWPIVVIVYFLVIVIDAIVLYIISPLGWPPVLIGVIGAILLLWKYSSVACSDPGIIYKNDIGGYQTQLLLTIDPENQNVEGLTNAVTNTVHQHQPNSMECGQCQIVRPNSARHCTYCSTCIDDLDHHCPWCGKCIGDRTIDEFHEFLQLLCFQIYFLIGTFVYFLICTYTNAGLPSGPSFR